SNQHSTQDAFFMRTEFRLPNLLQEGPRLEQAFKATVAGRYGMQWRMTYASVRKRVAIFVSRGDHALLELLWQHRAGDLAADIVAVVSNHTNNQALVERQGIAFFHVPMSAATKPEAEAREHAIIAEHNVDTIVLARYMQV